MTSLADTLTADVLRRVFAPREPLSHDQYLDRVALFVHPDTLKTFFDAGRLQWLRIGGVGIGSGSELYFTELDREYAGKRVCLDDTLEPGKVFVRVSPPELHDEDVRLEQTDGYMVTAHCDKAGMSFNFDPAISRETMLTFIRRAYAKDRTRFLLYVPPAIMTVQTYD